VSPQQRQSLWDAAVYIMGSIMDKLKGPEDHPDWWGLVFFLGQSIRYNALLEHDYDLVDTVNSNWGDFYHEYLQSKQWKVRSNQARKRAGYRCQLCNSKKSLEVHHRTYERIGFESQDDLIVLCNKCHEKFHG